MNEEIIKIRSELLSCVPMSFAEEKIIELYLTHGRL